MQVEEESPKQYVDIARAPDNKMRPVAPSPSGLWPGRAAQGGAVPAPVGVGATPERTKRAG